MGDCGIVANIAFLTMGDGERLRPPTRFASTEDDLGFFLNLSGVPKNFLFSSAIETNFGFTTAAFEGHNLSTIWAAFSLLICFWKILTIYIH